MVHIGGSHSPLPEILKLLRSGDVITHSFRGGDGGILTDDGRVYDEVLETVARGVHLDIGHGAGSFSFDTAEKAMEQGLLPGTVSSDVHQFQRQRAGVRLGDHRVQVPPPRIDAR